MSEFLPGSRGRKARKPVPAGVVDFHGIPEVLAAASARPDELPGGMAAVGRAQAATALATIETMTEQAGMAVVETIEPSADAAREMADAVAETMTNRADAVAAEAIEPPAHAARGLIDTIEETAPAAMTALDASPFSRLMKGMTMATAFDTMKTNEVFGDMNEKAKGAMEKSAKFAEGFSDFAKGNVEAMVASGRVAAKGVEEMAQYGADYGRKTVEQATAAMKSFAAVKSPTELFQLQSEYAKTAVDAMVSETSKFTESYLKLLGDIAQPLTSRYAVAAEKIKTVAA